MNPYTYIYDDLSVGLALMELDKFKLLAVDSETTGLDPLDINTQLRLIQVACPEQTYIFDCFYLGQEGLADLRRFFESDAHTFIAHNAKFDIEFIRMGLGVKRIPHTICTYLTALILDCGLFLDTEYGHGLADCVRKYLGLEMSKEQQRSDWSRPTLTPNQIKYAAYDAEVLLALWPVMAKELLATGQMRVGQIEFGAVNGVASLELNGFYLDPNRWRKLCEEISLNWASSRQELQEMLAYTPKNGQQGLFGKESRYINVDSPKQLIPALLYHGVPVPRKEETGKYTTSKYLMNALAINHPLVNYLRKYRVLEKQRSSYGLFWLDLIHPFTGRLHMDIKQIGAKTGRMAISRIQQVPTDSRYRSCFTANKGHVLVGADFSQIELRILADLSLDPGMIEAFRRGVDFHQFTADRIHQPRPLAKNLSYALPYGAGYVRFSLMCDPPIPLEQAQAIMDADRRAFPRKHAWLERAGKDAVRNKSSRSRSGRLTKYLYDPNDLKSISRTERNGKNTPIQGLNADITKRAIHLVDNEIYSDPDIKLVHVVHDELQLEVVDEPSTIKRASDILNDCMTQSAQEFIKTVPIKVDLHVGHEWSK